MEQPAEAEAEASMDAEEQEEFPERVKRGPITSSRVEVDQHEATEHASFRNWCAECIRGRGREMGHSQGDHTSDSTPVLSWDYGFLLPPAGQDFQKI